MEKALSVLKKRIPHEGFVTFLSSPQKSNQNRWKILHRLEGLAQHIFAQPKLIFLWHSSATTQKIAEGSANNRPTSTK